MDSAVNQLAREMTDAIAAAVAGDAKVEACREKARAAGFESVWQGDALQALAWGEAPKTGRLAYATAFDALAA